MDIRQSLRSKRPLKKDDSPAESNDGELSSGSRASNHSQRTLPKKIKRATKKEILQVICAYQIFVWPKTWNIHLFYVINHFLNLYCYCRNSVGNVALKESLNWLEDLLPGKFNG